VRAPDLFEPLLGWRSWRVAERQDGDFALTSVVRSVEWPARSELEAECLRSRWLWWTRRRPHRDHSAPDRDCVCGVYAAATAAEALRYVDVGEGIGVKRPSVVGVVKLWGAVLQCERGWRAAFAYPARLFVIAGGKPDADPWRVAAGLRRYGVPVEVLDAGGMSVLDVLVLREERVEFEAPPLPRGR